MADLVPFPEREAGRHYNLCVRHAWTVLVRSTVLVLSGLTAVTGCSYQPATPPRVLVFAAASLKNALDEVASALGRDEQISLTMSYAASSTLAKQIDAGAPAELFISADIDWMNDAAAHGAIRAGSRIDLLGNELVLIAPASQPVSIVLAPGVDLLGALHAGRLAVANPTSVPAGKYAKAALTSLGLWEAVATHLAPAEDVRAALQLVARGEAPLGIVYQTDVIASHDVVIVATFPPASHPPIVYPAALTSHATGAATRALAYLRGPAARAIFERQGFTVLAR